MRPKIVVKCRNSRRYRLLRLAAPRVATASSAKSKYPGDGGAEAEAVAEAPRELGHDQQLRLREPGELRGAIGREPVAIHGPIAGEVTHGMQDKEAEQGRGPMAESLEHPQADERESDGPRDGGDPFATA